MNCMCLTYPCISRASIDTRILAVRPYSMWLRSASSLFFHRESGIIKCSECYTSASENEKRNYRGVLWHYIHLGLLERFESYSAVRAKICTFQANSGERSPPPLETRRSSRQALTWRSGSRASIYQKYTGGAPSAKLLLKYVFY